MKSENSNEKTGFFCAVCRRKPSRSEIICPVTLGFGTSFDLVECSDCLTRRLFPLPTDEELNNFYNTGYYGGDWYKQRGWGKTFRQMASAAPEKREISRSRL